MREVWKNMKLLNYLIDLRLLENEGQMQRIWIPFEKVVTECFALIDICGWSFFLLNRFRSMLLDMSYEGVTFV